MHFCGVWVQNYVLNFKGHLWNLTQNFGTHTAQNMHFTEFICVCYLRYCELRFSISTKNSMKSYFAVISFWAHFCKCHGRTVVVTCAKLCSDHLMRIWIDGMENHITIEFVLLWNFVIWNGPWAGTHNDDMCCDFRPRVNAGKLTGWLTDLMMTLAHTRA